MLAARSADVALKPTIRTVSAKTLRQWCAPEVILLITNLADETVIVPHAIKQARQSHAKIVLAHVVSPQKAVSMSYRPLPRPTSRLQEARSIVERMARQFRWLGFTCEPLVVTGHPQSEIPLIARNFCVDRVIVSFDDNPDLAKVHMLTTPIGQLWPKLDVPTCVIGGHVGLASPNGLLTRNVTLAVSLDSDCDVPLAFACRFAQELRAKLTILHVIGRGNCGRDPADCTPIAIAGRLPNPTWREAELFCPTEIRICEGEPAEEILKYGASTNQDLMILCSSGASSSGLDWRMGVTYNVMAGAQCPIFVLQKQLGNASNDDAVVEAAQKVSAYGESVKSSVRKEVCSLPALGLTK